ncbi:Atrnl1 [Symbiodinium sp. KB8]|nr:Atrnl1 [Symbiodinium sp. KB8]
MVSAAEHAWPQPLNVRTAAANRPDGEVPQAFRQKQSIVPGELDIRKTMAQAHLGASVSLFGEIDAASGEDLLNVSAAVVFRATLDLGSAFWRAVVTRREKDFGFVHASRRGVWGALEHSRLPTKLGALCLILVGVIFNKIPHCKKTFGDSMARSLGLWIQRNGAVLKFRLRA